MAKRRGWAALFGLTAGPWLCFVGTSLKRPEALREGCLGHVVLNAGASSLQRQPECADATLTPSVTHFGINTLALEIAGKRILIDPLLVGNLVFFGQSWAFRGKRRENAQSIRPEEVLDSFDAIVITQSLDDHCHRPTLERVDRRMPIISTPSAAKAIEQLGFSPSLLQPGESLMLGKLRISALPGSVVGPPWQDPENGYVFTDTRPGGLSIGTEPHGNLLGPALGTSFKRLPSSSTVPPLDAVILPLTSQQISGYRLVNGVQEAADTLEALDPVPRFLLPLRNAELDASGFLAEQLQEDGSVETFTTLQRSRPKLRHVQLLDLQPGQLVNLELSPGAQHSA